MNRIHNSNNPYQNPAKFRRALCLCSAGLLRSPTLAFELMTKHSRNCRPAGTVEAYALIMFDDVLLSWADEVWCVSNSVKNHFWEICERNGWDYLLAEKTIITLDIPDNYSYMDAELLASISKQVAAVIPPHNLPA